jgi:hypothetical protein
MPSEKIGEDLLTILSVIRDRGGTDCTGTCHHRKPGEFHCHTFGRMLNLSSQGVKNRILELLRAGLLKRNRLDRNGSTLLVRFTVTPKGESVLDSYKRDSA